MTESIGFWNLAASHPDAVAAVDDESGVALTRGDLAARSNQVVHGLHRLGARPGDTVALMAGNELPFLEVLLAALQAGWYVVPLNPHLRRPEVEHVLGDSGARILVAAASCVDVARGAAAAADVGEDRVLVFGEGSDGSYERLVAEQPAARPDGRTAGWMMTYTSGTSGRPKGIKRPLSGRDPDDVGEVWSLPMRIFGVTGTQHVHLVQSPMYHTAVLVYVNASLQYGHRVVLMRQWEAERALGAISRHRVTTTHMVPTHFHRLLQLPDEVRAAADVSSLQYAVHGAAPCPVETKRRMIAWLGPVVFEYYGASEGGGTVVSPEEWLARPGTVGRAWPGGEVRILDEAGNELPPGEAGLVWMATGALDFDYHHEPQRTAEAKRDGFFTVGDVGHMDEDGYLFLHGRASEIIITGGINVHPSEVEGVLHQHADVADVGVIGLPDEEWGEAVVAVVQPREGVEALGPLAAELRELCRERLTAHMVPRSVRFVDELPRDPNGKLFTRLLLEELPVGRS